MYQVFLVSGGFFHRRISSTELLLETASAWVFTGELPSLRSGLRGANIDNKILMTGRYNSISCSIEFKFLAKTIDKSSLFESYPGGWNGHSLYTTVL